jgi:hypothetical protein
MLLVYPRYRLKDSIALRVELAGSCMTSIRQALKLLGWPGSLIKVVKVWQVLVMTTMDEEVGG